MEPDLSRFEIAPEGIINSENTGIFNPVSRQEHLNVPNPSVSNPAGATPRMPTGSLAADNQLMTNYISSPHPDLPNQYNIIIAGDDDEDDDDDDVISQTLNSPQAHSMEMDLQGDMDLQHPGSIGEQSLNDQAMGGLPYRSYTVQFKLNALDWYYKNGENKNLTAKMFNVDRKRIRDWLLDERNLRTDPTPQRTKRKRANSLPQYKDIEDALYKFYIAQREKGIRPKNAELRAKSLEFASMLGYRETFKASIHWLCNWKRRNKISFAVPDHVTPSSAAEEEEDSGAATPPFMEERLARPQMYKMGRGGGGGNYTNAAGVDGVQSATGGNVGYAVKSEPSGGGGGVAYTGTSGGNMGYAGSSNPSGGSGNMGYVTNSVSSRSSPSGGHALGRVVASSGADGLALPRSSNGAGVGGRGYGSTGIDSSSLAQPRSSNSVGGVAYSGTGLDGLGGSRSLGMDGVSLGERRREAAHHIPEQSVSECVCVGEGIN